MKSLSARWQPTEKRKWVSNESEKLWNGHRWRCQVHPHLFTSLMNFSLDKFFHQQRRNFQLKRSKTIFHAAMLHRSCPSMRFKINYDFLVDEAFSLALLLSLSLALCLAVLEQSSNVSAHRSLFYLASITYLLCRCHLLLTNIKFFCVLARTYSTTTSIIVLWGIHYLKLLRTSVFNMKMLCKKVSLKGKDEFDGAIPWVMWIKKIF